MLDIFMERIKNNLILVAVLAWLNVGLGNEATCAEPEPVANVYRIWDAGFEGSWVNYSCYDGFFLKSGNLSRRCVEGEYSGEEPDCVLDCGNPRNVYGADRNYTQRVNNKKSSVTYTCWENYTQIDSSMTITCNDYVHRWSRDAARCKSDENLALKANIFATSASEVQTFKKIEYDKNTSCITSDAVTNPIIKFDLSKGDVFYEISEVLFRLPDNLAENLPDMITITIRKTRSSWSFPNCGIIDSADLVTGELLKINCTQKAFGQSVVIIPNFTKEPVIISICDVEIYGRLHVVDCGRPNFVYGAKSYFNSTSFKSKAVYDCETNFYRLNKPRKASCLFFNEWNYEQIKCTNEANLALNRIVTDNKQRSIQFLTDNMENTCTNLGINDQSGWRMNFSEESNGFREIVITMKHGKWNIWENMNVIIESNTGQKQSCESNPGQLPSSNTHTFVCHSYPVGSALIVNYSKPSTFDICEINVFGFKRKESQIFECLRSETGREYSGVQNKTMSGKTCIYWVDTNLYPDDQLEGLNNYCRNPKGLRLSPWCFTSSDPDTWEYCPIINCTSVCSLTTDGSDYLGKLDKTISGKACQIWSMVDKARPKFSRATFPDFDNTHKYCRNPGSSQSRPWCYTDSNSLKHEHCVIAECPLHPLLDREEYSKSDDINIEYSECLIWSSSDSSKLKHILMFRLVKSWMEKICDKKKFNIAMFCCKGASPNLSWRYVFVKCYDDVSTILPTTSSVTAKDDYINISPTEDILEFEASSFPKLTIAEDQLYGPVTQEPLSTALAETILADYSEESKISVPESTCACQFQKVNQTSIEIVRERIINMTAELTIPKETLSATIRRRKSAADDRPSVSFVGYLAMGILFLTMLIIIIPDILQVFIYIQYNYCNNSGENYDV